MGLCVLYYVVYSLYNVKKSGIFLSGLELHFNYVIFIVQNNWNYFKWQIYIQLLISR